MGQKIRDALENASQFNREWMKSVSPSFDYDDILETSKDIFATTVLEYGDVGMALDIAIEGFVAHVLNAVDESILEEVGGEGEPNLEICGHCDDCDGSCHRCGLVFG